MASACVNKMGMSPEKFLDCSPAAKYHQSFGWLSPRMSFSREFQDDVVGDSSKVAAGAKHTSSSPHIEKKSSVKDKAEELDPEVSKDMVADFEFRLEDPVTMLPADELFSDGKLVPLHLSMVRPATTTISAGVRSPDTPQLRMRNEILISNADPYLFSPKAPRCTTRWRELLGLKKQQQHQNNNAKQETQRTSSLPSSTSAHKSLKNYFHRSSKSLSASLDSSLNLPLLQKDSDNESVSISSRLSLSSSSSGHDHDDLPRLSLDSDKPSNFSRNIMTNPRRVRLVKHRVSSSEAARVGRSPVRRQPAADSSSAVTTHARGVSVDSPRMNSSGKIVFHSLERSSSSPSTFNGGPRYKHRGMERSYSANVRVTPVLNVPVCSLRGSSKFGFPLFSSSSSSSQQKKEGTSSNSYNIRSRTDRIKE
ncbi:uncharacterized protein LOC107783922 [Nicotiana tabacum]|uniref:Uncharacterized protein LOC107783922 n=1 Tax=Nicotiana tabacum TaxID=4097 RepID=A0A1S3Z7V0_TOBAC|nr:PREDICTED: uncharacterized protein LOC107783922 [Nicotiana tabacum]